LFILFLYFSALFEIGDIEYIDVRLTDEEWINIKPSFKHFIFKKMFKAPMKRALSFEFYSLVLEAK
jgi:hypothetical protein